MQQQVDHVSHVCFIYRPENFHAAIKQFSDAFGIDDWDGPAKLPYFGILQTQSVSAGIEILAPIEEGTQFSDYLSRHGEGFFALIYGVRDVEAAARKAMEKGIEPVYTEDGQPMLIDAMTIDNGQPAYASWPARIKIYKEIPLQPVGGVNVYLGQIEPIGGGVKT